MDMMAFIGVAPSRASHKKTQVPSESGGAGPNMLAIEQCRSYGIEHIGKQTRMTHSVNRFLGDTPGRTIIKLILVCLVVGFILAFFGYTPDNIVGSLRYHLLDIWYNGFEAIGAVGNYLILGAIVVIPVFIILRLMSYRR
jgi:hypothetical protein